MMAVVLDVVVVVEVPTLIGITIGSSHPRSWFCTVVVFIAVLPNALCPLMVVESSCSIFTSGV